MKRILLIALLLQGCIVEDYDYKVIHPDIIYVGDSLCLKVFDTDTGIKDIYEKEAYKKTAQAMLGIVSNCVPGRKIIDLQSLPKGYKTTILALGSNDVGHTEINVFAEKYSNLVYNSDSEVLYCVLPAKKVLGKSSEEYREVIRGICANVIEPEQYGIKFRAKDTAHMNEFDHALWYKALRRILYI